jgi:hypothetical protein
MLSSFRVWSNFSTSNVSIEELSSRFSSCTTTASDLVHYLKMYIFTFDTADREAKEAFISLAKGFIGHEEDPAYASFRTFIFNFFEELPFSARIAFSDKWSKFSTLEQKADYFNYFCSKLFHPGYVREELLSRAREILSSPSPFFPSDHPVLQFSSDFMARLKDTSPFPPRPKSPKAEFPKSSEPSTPEPSKSDPYEVVLEKLEKFRQRLESENSQLSGDSADPVQLKTSIAEKISTSLGDATISAGVSIPDPAATAAAASKVVPLVPVPTRVPSIFLEIGAQISAHVKVSVGTYVSSPEAMHTVKKGVYFVISFFF